jgi:hypothetical protein
MISVCERVLAWHSNEIAISSTDALRIATIAASEGEAKPGAVIDNMRGFHAGFVV